MKGLKYYRTESGITQNELSEKLGIPLSNIAMYETGDRTPSLRRAMMIAEYFEVSVEDIFFGQEHHS